MNSLLFVYLYLFLLAGHFTYAWMILRSNQFSLALGPFRTHGAILGMLLLINGLSLSAFVYPRPWWVLVHIVFHILLALDELWRMKRVQARWPFFVNQIGFVWVLYLYYGTIIEAERAL